MFLADAAASQGSPFSPLLLLAIGFGALYFFMIRPQKKRVEEQRRLQSGIEVGDEVLTIGGIFGIVRHIDEDLDEITLEVAPGSTLRIVRNAVARKVVVEDEDESAEGTDDAWTEATEESWTPTDESDPEAGKE
jgi:preprotein translocase subunit YajC